MSKSQTFRFEYLRREDDIFFLGLKGPRGGIHSFPLAKEDMTRLRDAYFRNRGAPPREEREAQHQAARQRMQQTAGVAGGDVGIPITLFIAERLGMSLEEVTAWEQLRRDDAQASRTAMVELLPCDDRHQVIRLGSESAVVVPLATYWSSRAGASVRPGIAVLAGTIEAMTVGEWQAEQEGEGDAGGHEEYEQSGSKSERGGRDLWRLTNG
jgi:hypothetical protein